VDSPSDPVGDTVSAPVVLTRPTGHNQGLACLLSPRDIPVLEWPGGVIEPLEHTAPERADVVVFASPNAVRHCEPFPQAVVIAQGPGTARSLQERGISVHHIADPPRSSGVVGAVLKCAEPPATIVIVGGDLRDSSTARTRIHCVYPHRLPKCSAVLYGLLPSAANSGRLCQSVCGSALDWRESMARRGSGYRYGTHYCPGPDRSRRSPYLCCL
jgi:hypothetical protein